jgi:hypothetical protein
MESPANYFNYFDKLNLVDNLEYIFEDILKNEDYYKNLDASNNKNKQQS